MSVHENLQLHSREACPREGGDCAGMTILAAVMINSRLDSMRFGSGFDVLRQAQHADKLSVPNL
jgi:hypothetical protein